MKRVLLLLLSSMASVAWAGELRLTVHGTGVVGKNLHVAVYASEQGFPSQEGNANIKSAVVVKEDITELVIPDIAAGEYAVAVFVDMNGNGVLDRNFIGIPKEPVGISRATKDRLGSPRFSDAAFKIGDGITAISIELK